MNLLLNGVPDHITVCDQDIPIKTDFRDWIKFETAMSGESNDLKKINAVMNIINGLEPSEDILKQVIWFYQCGVEGEGKSNNTKVKKIYDFEKDQYTIYTAFRQYYSIDLTSEKMHWWIFKQMFMELPDESKIKKIMMYRSISVNSNMSKEQRKFYAEMKRFYALPDKRTAKEKSISFGSVLAKGMKVKE